MAKESMGLNFEIARRREIKCGNSGLPKGAVKCTGEEVNRLLREIWIEEIRFYNDTCHSVSGRLLTIALKSALRGCQVEESDFESRTFNKNLNPQVEGYDWYRGFAVKVRGGKVLIFSGWMQPWREGGAPDPIVYLLGGVSRKTVFRVIQIFCSNISEQVIKARNTISIAEEARNKAKESGASDAEARERYEIVYKNAMK